MPERLVKYLDTNVVGTHRITQAFIPALLARQTRKIGYISSTFGSPEKLVQVHAGLQGPCTVSKAASNLLSVRVHDQLYGEEFKVVAIHLVWVETDMRATAGDTGMEAEKSVRGLFGGPLMD